MEQRLSFVTLAVKDRDASRRFYVEGLGWTPYFDDVDVIMIKIGPHLMLSLWEEASFETEVGPIRRGEGLAPVTLAHNVRSPDEVDAVLATARAAGADPVSEGQRREWGGYTGYFGDPDGFRWEIAWAPGELTDQVVPD